MRHLLRNGTAGNFDLYAQDFISLEIGAMGTMSAVMTAQNE
jgi:hypothetical protein